LNINEIKEKELGNLLTLINGNSKEDTRRVVQELSNRFLHSLFPKIHMQYSLKLAFWDRLLQAQYLQQYEQVASVEMFDERCAYSDQAVDPTFDFFPEMAREKFYQSWAFFCAGDIVASLNAAFQALEICSFTLGSNHPTLSVIMQHIATICESQGLRLEAQRMRREALELVVNDQYRHSAETPYLH
jgi:hypothetical protein